MADSPIKIRNLTEPNQVADYVEPISAAFENYIVMERAFRTCSGPRIDWIRRMLRGGFASKLMLGTPVPAAYVNKVAAGAMNLYLPSIEPSEEAKAWWPKFLEEAGPETESFFEGFFDFTKSVELPPHVLVGMVGVSPEFQGQGVGRALLEHAIELATNDPAAEGVGLDTEVAENVGLYEKFGFQVMGRGDVDGMPVWVMFRPN